MFTEEEFDKLCSIFSKFMAQRKNLPDNEWKKNTNKLIKSIATKFSAKTEPSQTGHEVHLDRKQLRLIQEAVQASNRILTENVIPEYERRGNLEEYRERANKLVALNSALLEKIEAVL